MRAKTSVGRDFQEDLLGRLTEGRLVTTLYLKNRMSLRGRILTFDPYVIVLDPLDGTPPQMVYKSSLVSISGPRRPQRPSGGPGAMGPRTGGRPPQRPYGSGPRPEGYRSEGPRFDGPRSEGPRSEGYRPAPEGFRPPAPVRRPDPNGNRTPPSEDPSS